MTKNQALIAVAPELGDWATRGSILRQLSRHHFAFFRGYLEGLELRLLARQYLESCDMPGDDLRETHTTLRWILGELTMLARRHGQFAYARLLALSPGKISDISDNSSNTMLAAPSLETFREEHDPDEYYGEAELLALFADIYPGKQPQADRKAARNQRLREKQARALAWLEARVVTDPMPDDGIAGWLAPVLSSRLVAAGLMTLRALLTEINGRGQRWYMTIPQLGEKSAARIVRWLQLNAATLGPIQPHVMIKRGDLDNAQMLAHRPRQHGIVPLEVFAPRHDLDGTHGLNRGVRNRSGVNDDYAAIQLWLSTITPGSHTWRSYRTQAERFLLWALLERGKPLSSLLTQDCIAYRDFLWDLGRLPPQNWSVVYTLPQDVWLGQRGTPRWSALWRPFERVHPAVTGATAAAAPSSSSQHNLSEQEHSRSPQTTPAGALTGVLSESSQKLAQTILTSMCEWLMRQRYLDSNPWDGVPARKKHISKIQVDHSFTQEQWQFLMSYLNGAECDARHRRLRFIVLFAYGTGLRLSEMTQARIGDLHYKSRKGGESDPGIGAWTLTVIGKGNKERLVVVPSRVMQELSAYLHHRGFAAVEQTPAHVPLIGRLVGFSSPQRSLRKRTTSELEALTLSDQALYKILKAFFKQAASAKAAESLSESAHLAQASTHWLRHTCGAHAVASGVPIEVVQANFGHASVDTTSIYITAEIDRRIEEMERFMQSSQTGASA